MPPPYTETLVRVHRPSRTRSRLAALAVLAALVVAAAGAYLLSRAAALRDAELPGVFVGGVDVGGLDRAEARARIAAVFGAHLGRPVTVRVGTRSFTIEPAALFDVDAAATEARAFAAGRESFWPRIAAASGLFDDERTVEPVLRMLPDAQRTLAAAVESAVHLPVSARVTMEDGRPVVRSGRPGIRVDAAALLEKLRSLALSGESVVVAPASRWLPEVTTADARAAAARAEAVLAAPVELTLAGEPIGALPQASLAELLRFQPFGGGYELVLDRDGLSRLLGPLVEPKTATPVDATFEVKGDRVRVIPSRGGTRLAPEKAAALILAAALAPSGRTAEIPLAKAEADLTTREAKALGIREVVSTFTTDMGASSPNRVYNVHLLGDLLDGTLLRPGETFSFNEVVGPRTPERGFLEGQMIFAGVLIPSIGGGVCQTATTVFNAAFEAGLPIAERVNHSFYISHYPMGRDATVSWGGPDLVFTNDLDHAILIEADYTDETFTVTFYGTGQERTVESETSEPARLTQPKLQFAVDPTAPPKSVRKTEGGGPGFDVTVRRRVYEDGKLIREDEFFTRYTPENPTKVFGPGKKPPEPYFVLPTTG